MAFRLGIVGLCTSHPSKWVPIIRTLVEEKCVDIEIAAVWDSGQTRPAGFARLFADEYHIASAIDKLEDMELNAIADSRTGQKRVRVNLDDL